jgi:hypothetical protein
MPPRDTTPSTPEESNQLSRGAVIATRNAPKEAEKQQFPRFYLCRSNRARWRTKKLSRTREETTTTTLELERTHNSIVEGRGYGGRNEWSILLLKTHSFIFFLFTIPKTKNFKKNLI